MFSPWLNYSPRVVNPPPGVIGEYEFFQRLARQMGLADFPRLAPTAFLQRSVGPLLETLGLSWEALRQAPVRIPADDVPWADGRFATPSGKYEFYSARAAADGHGPLPVYQPPAGPPTDYPLRLLTTHYRHSMHSQHFMDRRDRPRAYLHPDEAERCGLAADQPVRLESPRGALAATVAVHTRVPPGVVQVHQGWWRHSGAVNVLTADALSAMGANAAYFETFCRVVPRPADPSSGKEIRR
jgi:anaerobic selenocysteine-containing dehydrogenase